MVRKYTERGQSMTSYPAEAATRYEFMPFNYWNDYKEEITHENGVTYNYPTVDIDHWFGMTMEFEFYFLLLPFFSLNSYGILVFAQLDIIHLIDFCARPKGHP